MHSVNVYDFDKTIYDGDSTVDFYLYCIRKYPKLLLTVPRSLFSLALSKLGFISLVDAKSSVYKFLTKIPNIDYEIKLYWNNNEKYIFDWYKKVKRDDDIIISASPEFLLREICNRLNIKRLIASVVDKHTGECISKNCKGEEKVRRLKEYNNNVIINNFYSDSKSDVYLARLAKNAYMIKNGEIKKWED